MSANERRAINIDVSELETQTILGAFIDQKSFINNGISAMSQGNTEHEESILANVKINRLRTMLKYRK